jgi:hypothetical protein
MESSSVSEKHVYCDRNVFQDKFNVLYGDYEEMVLILNFYQGPVYRCASMGGNKTDFTADS